MAPPKDIPIGINKDTARESPVPKTLLRRRRVRQSRASQKDVPYVFIKNAGLDRSPGGRTAPTLRLAPTTAAIDLD